MSIKSKIKQIIKKIIYKNLFNHKKCKNRFNKSFKTVLLNVLGPQQIPTGLATVKTLYGENTNIIFVYTSASKQVGKQILTMAKNIKNVVDIYEITLANTQRLEALTDFKKAIPKKLLNHNICSIIYPHDALNHLINIISETYENAEICRFGDAYGYFFEKKNFSKEYWDKEYEKPEKFKEIKVDKYCAMLPYFKHYNPPKNKFQLVEKQTMLDILDNILPKDLKNYCKKFLKNFDNKNVGLLLTSTYTELGCTTVDKGVLVYKEAIETIFPKGSVVLIKTHPAETVKKIDKLQKSLSPDYTVIKLDNKLNLYPIEALCCIINKVKSIAVLGSSSKVSLKYLYNLDVRDIYTEQSIDMTKYLKVGIIEKGKSSRAMLSSVLEKLENWDKTKYLNEN